MMNFLEANRILKSLRPVERRDWLLAMSGTPDLLSFYLRAHAAGRAVTLDVDTLPFGTLPQYLMAPATAARGELIVLLPYDFVPESDPRSGVVEVEPDWDGIVGKANALLARIEARPNARVAYLAAPLMPVWVDQTKNRQLQHLLAAMAARLDPQWLPPDAFSMSSYLASGCPIDGANLSRVAEILVELTELRVAPAKVLVTDLDNTLWRGVVAEDGEENLEFGAEGPGFKYFIYQTLLRKLRAAGVLLAAVSRNDADIVEPPFANGRMPLRKEDFIAIQASYGAKSDHIRQLAAHLNLGLDSFVFVDDNAVELEEVAKTLPEVRVLPFPLSERELAPFVDRLMALFARREITAEDRMRTQMYRQRIATIPPTASASSHAELTEFLKGLRMQIAIHDRSVPVGERAIQLINKTNQFNMNGRRAAPEEVSSLVAMGYILLTASLKDCAGDHGEIVSVLVAPDGTLTHFVMSCRVLQRHVEFVILDYLLRRFGRIRFEYLPTERNTPFRQFLEALRLPSDLSLKAGDSCPEAISVSAELFEINEPKAN
jgi:FkbH-like protein